MALHRGVPDLRATCGPRSSTRFFRASLTLRNTIPSGRSLNPSMAFPTGYASLSHGPTSRSRSLGRTRLRSTQSRCAGSPIGASGRSSNAGRLSSFSRKVYSINFFRASWQRSGIPAMQAPHFPHPVSTEGFTITSGTFQVIGLLRAYLSRISPPQECVSIGSRAPQVGQPFGFAILVTRD